MQSNTKAYKMSSEQEIISGCIVNDRLSQKMLYENYKSHLYTVIYRTVGNFEEADDVLQESFVKIFRSMESYSGKGSLAGWMRTICIRTAYAKIKKRVSFDELTEAHENVSMEWVLDMDTDYLHQAIQALPNGFRMVFTMIEIEGYSHKEVANILSISEGTSKSQLSRAKKKLKESLINRWN